MYHCLSVVLHLHMLITHLKTALAVVCEARVRTSTSPNEMSMIGFSRVMNLSGTSDLVWRWLDNTH
jgi:hypothetical protein